MFTEDDDIVLTESDYDAHFNGEYYELYDVHNCFLKGLFDHTSNMQHFFIMELMLQRGTAPGGYKH